MKSSSSCVSISPSRKAHQLFLFFSLVISAFLLAIIPNNASATGSNKPRDLSPSGYGADLQPDFSWRRVEGVSEYQLWIRQGGTQLLDERISAAALGCDASDAEICTYAPAFSLIINTSVYWRVGVIGASPRNNRSHGGRRGGGYGGHRNRWSSQWYRVTTPAAPRTKAPRHIINESAPVYTWQAVKSADSYELKIQSNGVEVFNGTVSAEAAGCAGSRNCAYTPDLTLDNGDYKWQVRGISEIGNGRWSRYRRFKVRGVDVTENQAPSAENKSVTTDKDTAVSISLGATDADGDNLIYTVDPESVNGGTITGTAPAVSYAPASGFMGTDTFTFKVNDGTVDSNTATITITVNSVNSAPIATEQSVTVEEDNNLEITLGGIDADSDPLSYRIASQPTNGALSGAIPTLTYTPNPNFNGTDSFTFIANDTFVDSVAATVSITVNSVNDLPSVDVGSDQVVNETEVVSITGSASDLETDETGLLYSWVQLSGPTVTLPGSNTATLIFTAPEVDTEQTLLFELMVTDGDGGAAVDQVLITVSNLNSAPTANEQSVAIDEDTEIGIELIGVDADGDALTYTIVTAPTSGSLLGTGPNQTYTPQDDFSGEDSFTFTVSDGITDSPEATVSITVNPIPEQPQNLIATEGSGDIFLEWDAVSDADSYIVCVATESIVGALSCPTESELGTAISAGASNSLLIDESVFDGGLEPGTEYFFIVFAIIDTDVFGDSSNEASAIPIGIVEPSPTGRLNDTGITTCGDYAYDGSGTHQNDLDCNLTVDADDDPIPAGQDGHFGRDATDDDNDPIDGHAGFNFTKIDADGYALDAGATEWSCVKDNVTGLIWEVKTDDGGLHHWFDKYHWYQTENNNGDSGSEGNTPICFGRDAADSASWCNTSAFADRVNAQGLCGANSGWRLPNKQELSSLINFGQASPAIDLEYFPNTAYWDTPTNTTNFRYYWTSSQMITNEQNAKLVGFNIGLAGGGNGKGWTYGYYVRLVRSGNN